MRNFFKYFVISILSIQIILLLAPHIPPAMIGLILFLPIIAMSKQKPLYALSFIIFILLLFLAHDYFASALAELEKIEPNKYKPEKHAFNVGGLTFLSEIVLSPVSYALVRLVFAISSKIKAR